LKAPGTNRLKLTCDEPLPKVPFKFNLRRYTEVERRRAAEAEAKRAADAVTHKRAAAAREKREAESVREQEALEGRVAGMMRKRDEANAAAAAAAADAKAEAEAAVGAKAKRDSPRVKVNAKAKRKEEAAAAAVTAATAEAAEVADVTERITGAERRKSAPRGRVVSSPDENEHLSRGNGGHAPKGNPSGGGGGGGGLFGSGLKRVLVVGRTCQMFPATSSTCNLNSRLLSQEASHDMASTI